MFYNVEYKISKGLKKRIMTRLDLIEQFENETELPATWSNGGMGGYTEEYTKWVEQKLVKNLTIPVVSNNEVAVCEYESQHGFMQQALGFNRCPYCGQSW